MHSRFIIGGLGRHYGHWYMATKKSAFGSASRVRRSLGSEKRFLAPTRRRWWCQRMRGEGGSASAVKPCCCPVSSSLASVQESRLAKRQSIIIFQDGASLSQLH